MDATQTEPQIDSALLDAPVSIEPPTTVEPTPAPQVVEPVVAAQPQVAQAPETESEFDAAIKFIEGETDELPAAKPAKAKAPEAEPAVELEPKVVEQPTAQPKVAEPAQAGRDYTGLTADERTLFQRMSNDAYAKLRPIYDRHKAVEAREQEIARREASVKEALPKGIFEAEEAYTITPQYRQAAEYARAMEFEADYWTKQLEAIESGEDWAPLMKDAEGRYVKGKAQAASVAAKSQVTRNIALATQYSAQAQGNVEAIRQTFAQRRSAVVEGVKSYEKKFFPFFEGENNQHRPQIQQLLNAIPEELRDSPLAEGYAKAMLTVKLLNANMQALQKQLTVKQAAAADAKRGGPSMTAVNNAAPTKATSMQPTIDNIEEFMGLR